ncbi:MAG: 50S ribosomal protein L4 [Candidatus Woesebacteria bacterium]|jgi:large subunit ribosomal protein L4
MKVKVINTSGKDSSVTVSDDLFVKKVNRILLAQAIKVYLSNQRQSTSATQNRSKVSRTTKKWYRQKGTGNARHGAKSANLFVGGATAHGPRGIENWKLSLSKKMRQAAIKHALSAQKDNLLINEDLLTVGGKTKVAAELLSKLAKDEKRVLIVLPESFELVLRAFKNIPNVLISQANRLNALEIVTADKVVFTKEALKTLEKRLLKQSVKKKAEQAKLNITKSSTEKELKRTKTSQRKKNKKETKKK